MANIMHLLLCVRLMNQIQTETWAGLTSMHPCNLSRIRNCRKFILYAYMHFPNFLASLLCCVRNGLCSIQQPLLLSLLPSWAGPWCSVILAGSPGSPCAQKLYSWETGYPAPETSQLLIALVVKAHFWPGFTISAFTPWCAFSLWDCTAETKVRTTLYSTAEKGLLWVSHLNRVVSVMQLHLSLQLPSPSSSLPLPCKCCNVTLIFCSFTNEVSVPSAETILTKVCKEPGWASGPLPQLQYFWLGSCSGAPWGLPVFFSPLPCPQYLLFYVAIFSSSFAEAQTELLQSPSTCFLFSP